jgi:DNA polymerase III delta prime subunit
MFRNSKPRQRNIRLEKQPGLPSIKTIEDQRQQTMINAGATVELPFGDETQTLILTCTRDTAQGNWLWMLYRDDGFSSALEWSQLCNDASYIQALIENSHPGLITHGRRTSDSIMKPESELPINIRKGSLEGNLRNIQIANLLQSVSMGNMTGRLQITAKNDTANVIFSAGKAVHATLRGAEGHEAILQLFGWDDGEFSFFDEAVTGPTTITRNLTGLMMAGTTYLDHFRYLQNKGLTNECYPVRLKDLTTGEELAAALKGSADCDLAMQASIYSCINNRSSWGEIVRNRSELKSEWVLALFNLVSCGIVSFEAVAPGALQQKSKKIDWSVVHTIEKSMQRADTGMCNFAALLYSLQQEFYRYESVEIPFSIVVFGFCQKHQVGEHPDFIPLKASAVRDLQEKVSKIKHKFDTLCHYGAFCYAVLLPLSNKESARRFSDMLAEVCSSIDLSDDYPANAIAFRAAVANIPEDCTNLDAMLEMAEII